MFHKLLKLYEDKTLSEMAARGFISTKLIDQLEIYLFIDKMIENDPKVGITEAVTQASAVFDRPIVYVWRAVNAVSGENYKTYKKKVTIKV